jgi:hypothetical protein
MFSVAALAQNNPTPFDCQFSGTLTAASPTTTAYFNKGPAAPCIAWRITYHTLNATGISLSLQGTGNLANGQPDTAHWTNLTAISPSVNPAIGTSLGSINAAYDYYPWIQLTAGTLTGTNASLTFTSLGYKGESASKGGSGTVTGGPFAVGNVVTGNGGQAIQDSGQALSGLVVNPMTAVGDMIEGGASPAGTPTRVPGNTTIVPKVLTQTGDGSNAGAPVWSVVTSGAALYYATDTASDVATDLQYTTSTFSPKTTLGPYALTVGTNNLQTWVTNAGVPGASYIPAGIYVVHVHYARSPTPIGTIYIQATINEVSSTGVYIATIGTTELSPAIPAQGGEQEVDLAYADSNTYTLGSTASRVAVIVQAISSSATPTVSLYVGGTADAHLALPSSAGGGSVTAVTGTSPIISSLGSTPAISLDTTKVPQKFFGTSAPGSVTGNLPGDLFTDTTHNNEYICGAPSGTAAPACTSVTAGGWMLGPTGATGPAGPTGPAGSAGAAGTNGVGLFWQPNPPDPAAFAWTNQGTSTAVKNAQYTVLNIPASGSHSLRMMLKAAPAPPWTLTAQVSVNCLISFTPDCIGGVVVSDGSKYIVIGPMNWGNGSVVSASNIELEATRYTNATTVSLQGALGGNLSYNNVFIQLTDTGYVSTSVDGVTFVQLGYLGSYLTSQSYIGFGADTTNSEPMGLTIQNWQLTSLAAATNLPAAPPITFADIATPTAPSAGNTAWYTKGGKLCSLSPASVEACTGSGGGPTTQTDVSGSRSFGVSYHNTLATPLFVNISLLCGAGSVALSTDASSTPTTIVAASTNGTVVSNYQFVSGIVLPGNYYQATNACSGTTTYWIEWH